MPRLAIIGGGFSGVTLAFNLVIHSQAPFKLFVFEKRDIAKGTAYSTTSPGHLLNVKAEQMSALTDQPDHFINWVNTKRTYWEAIYPALKTLEIKKESYLPRCLYGLYLKGLWKETLEIARSKGIGVELIHQEVLSIDFEDTFTLFCEKGEFPFINYCLLACGVPENGYLFPELLHSARYVHNLWRASPESLLSHENLSFLPASTTVLIVGSGLTMLDAVVTLQEKKFPGEIIALSRHGKLPEVHKQLDKSAHRFFPSALPLQAKQLLRSIHAAIKEANHLGIDWRQVMEELRPLTQKTWEALPKKEKQRLLSSLSLWNRHRHRMSDRYQAIVRELGQKNRFDLMAGMIQSIEIKDPFLKISIMKKDGIFELKAHYLINCTGPNNLILQSSFPLIQSLMSQGYLKPDEVGLGALVDVDGSLIGKAQGHLFAVGQLLFGSKLEITAVPELRENSRKTAQSLCKKFCL